MRKPFDLLFTDREPFLLIEKAIVHQRDGVLFSINEKDGELSIPIAKYATIALGHGTSITHSAALLCAKHDTHISFVRGGLNLHSFWMAGRWQDPRKVAAQAIINSDDQKRLKSAKFLLKIRVKTSKFKLDHIKSIEAATSIEQVMAIEGTWYRSFYKALATQYSVKFKRDHKDISGVNGKLSLLCNLLYGYCTSLILCAGLHPSIGFMHGKTRRGGLSFDLADVIKPMLVLEPSFSRPNEKNSIAMRRLSLKITSKNHAVSKFLIQILNEIVLETWNEDNCLRLLETWK